MCLHATGTWKGFGNTNLYQIHLEAEIAFKKQNKINDTYFGIHFGHRRTAGYIFTDTL